jgi:RNA polymerase sigma factor (sigma-70 family)
LISQTPRGAPPHLFDLLQHGTPAALSDRELLDRFTSRPNEHDETAETAFAALLARHGPMVLRVCRSVLGARHEVEDAFQATFLVLAVRARSIHRRGSVASWLHGVALRVAAAERSRAARRRRHEVVRAAMTSSTTLDAETDPVCEHEQSVVIHEEIGCLPEKYRAPVVLCYMEGRTHEMAALELGWPVGSVKSRLAWARQRLRARLIRRGVAPMALPMDRSAPPADAELAAGPALLATHLADSTLRAALKVGLGKGALVGIVSAEAVALMEKTIRSMTSAQLVLATAAVLVAGLLTAGAGVMAYAVSPQQKPAGSDNPAQKSGQPGAASPVSEVRPSPAATNSATDQGTVTVQAEVVDPDGRPVEGADVAIAVHYSRGSADQDVIVERTRSDRAGQVRREFARGRPGAVVSHVNLWAYQAGHALTTTNLLLRGRTPPPVSRLTLDRPSKWTVTVLGPEGTPIAALRLTPRSLRQAGRRAVLPSIPDVWLEPLTVTTDANGVATLMFLPATLAPLSVTVAGSGIAPHTVPLDVTQGRDVTLKLGRPGRAVGIVRTASGEPLAGVPIEVWAHGSGTLSSDLGFSFGNRQITPDAVVPIGREVLKTGPQGAFQTPSSLLAGFAYRVSVRHEGFVPFVSDWVTMAGERATVPDIRLQPLLNLTGRINDRQGRAVAGARAFLPAGGPSAVTDADGRFALAGVGPGKTVVLVEKSGFRLQGWPIDPPAHPDLGPLTLARASEPSEPAVHSLADPIPPAEARALADQLLAPYLRDEPNDGDDRARLAAIEAVSGFDPDRALNLLQSRRFRDDDFRYQGVRGLLAVKLAARDPARAAALAESIPVARSKINALVGVAKALPCGDRERKRALLEKAAAALNESRERPAGLLRFGSAIAEQWLDMGEPEKARALLPGGKIGPEALQSGFLGQLARLEPDQAVARMRELPNFSGNPDLRDDELAAVAVQLATEHPAEAEQVYNLREVSGTQTHSLPNTLRLCRRLARVDPARARRVAASQIGTGARACAWAYVALGLAEKDKAGASLALDTAIEEIDRLRASGPGPEQVYIVGGIRLMYPTNPAATVLPVIERAFPERLAEFFWRAVALHPRIEPDPEEKIQTSYVGFECMVLAHYDREVAAALFAPVDSYLRALTTREGPRTAFYPSLIVAEACVDPRTAVSMLESLTPAGKIQPSGPADSARIRLAQVLGAPPEKRWPELWRALGAQSALDD